MLWMAPAISSSDGASVGMASHRIQAVREFILSSEEMIVHWHRRNASHGGEQTRADLCGNEKNRGNTERRRYSNRRASKSRHRPRWRKQ